MIYVKDGERLRVGCKMFEILLVKELESDSWSFAEGRICVPRPKKLSAFKPLAHVGRVHKFFGDEWMKLIYFQYLKKKKGIEFLSRSMSYIILNNAVLN